jgi:anaerobic C4-dicarboxylate transporter
LSSGGMVMLMYKVKSIKIVHSDYFKQGIETSITSIFLVWLVSTLIQNDMDFIRILFEKGFENNWIITY